MSKVALIVNGKAKISLTVTRETWPLAKPFVIARGSRIETEVVKVTLNQDYFSGSGESVPTARFGEDVATVIAQIQSVATKLADCSEDLDNCRKQLQQWLPAGSARNALDSALWDLNAKIKQISVSEQLNFVEPKNIITVQTISIDSPENMGKAAALLQDFPLLKIKLNQELIIERLNAVHANAPKAKLLIDANESWDIELLEYVDKSVKYLPILLIEQPLKAGEDGILKGRNFSLPIGADESCHTCADIAYLADRYDVINIKLDKTGGLTEGVKLAKLAKAHSLQVMVGCMVGTSLSMAPGLVLATQASYVDLDAPLLIKADRPFGLQINKGNISGLPTELWGHC
ncbi:N-acetyl-D-Glu racemase DgcA [Colwellia psychrerythraea]|uniref:Dipeptide epimerase n=1 Tax=Colwellia psychrerythraea TaxID=28229 RepID=A0A099KJF1_COLPS|nr:N-acetyl-D-Glu racemase DgcA [Colwellia psychrerythraea]KGJ90959.1 Mandelate racemase/muconate lactonizing protein [Colwellia psychrerythraea]